MRAPTGITAPSARWIEITGPTGKPQLAAVYRPARTGTYPLVVVFHGSSGLPALELVWAARLATYGYIVVAGCYLDRAAGSAPDTFVACPGLRNDAQATATNVKAALTTLIDGATTLEGVESGAVGAVGVSFGAIALLSTKDARVRAIVADSGYRQTAGTTSGPVLLLGFTTDPNVAHDRLVAFERAQQAAGNAVESHYYTGTGHVTVLSPATTDDATARVVAFLRGHLG